MFRMRCSLAMALCLSACACGPHGSPTRAPTAPATPVANGGFVQTKPKPWEVTAGFRWARPGVWSPVSEKPGAPAVAIASTDGLGGRIVRLGYDGGYDVWQARIDCDTATATVSEGIHIDAAGRHGRNLSTAEAAMGPAGVHSFCSADVHRPGGLDVAQALLARPSGPAYLHAVPPRPAAFAHGPAKVPPLTPDALKRMERERQEALAGAK